jgi:hypothetical protein
MLTNQGTTVLGKKSFISVFKNSTITVLCIIYKRATLSGTWVGIRCKDLLLKQIFTYKCFHNFWVPPHVYPPPPSSHPQPEGNPCCDVNHHECGSNHDDSLWCFYHCVRFLARWNTCYCAFIRIEGSPNRFYIISKLKLNSVV